MKKLALRTPSDLVRYAIGRGILPLDPGLSRPDPSVTRPAAFRQVGNAATVERLHTAIRLFPPNR